MKCNNLCPNNACNEYCQIVMVKKGSNYYKIGVAITLIIFLELKKLILIASL